MAAGKSISDILAGAKAELGRADALDKSVKSEVPAAPAPKHEYSNAPYALVKKPSPIKNEIGQALKEKAENVRKVSQ